MKPDFFDAIKKLHEYELYEDLLLHADLNINEAKICDSLRADEQALIFICIADAFFHTSQFSNSIKYYDRAIKSLSMNRRQILGNQHENTLNVSELRFRMHKALLKNNKPEEALRCLESIPRGEMTPKVHYAVVKLNLLFRKPPRLTASPQLKYGPKVVSSLRSIVEQVPEAILCRSVLIATSNLKMDENMTPPPGKMSPETNAWLLAKQAESNKNFTEAIQSLTESGANNYRIAVEIANYYRTCGDRKQALIYFERARAMDSTNVYGMDGYASLLGQMKMNRELELLANGIMTNNPTLSESFVVYGYFARAQKRLKEATQFAMRAVTLATHGRQRSEAFLLKALILMDVSRYAEADESFQEALYSDTTNLDVYEHHMKLLISQKRVSEAIRASKSAKHMLGEGNPRAQYLTAYLWAEGSETLSDAMSILEDVVVKAPYIFDAIILLANVYDKFKLHEKAIKMLKKAVEIHGDSILHRLLGDFYAKTNQTEAAAAEYRLALNSSSTTDEKALAAMNALNVNRSFGAGLSNSSSDFCTPLFNSGAGGSQRGAPAAPVAPSRARRIAQIQHSLHSRRCTTAAAVSSSSSSTNTVGGRINDVLAAAASLRLSTLSASSSSSSTPVTGGGTAPSNTTEGVSLSPTPSLETVSQSHLQDMDELLSVNGMDTADSSSTGTPTHFSSGGGNSSMCTTATAPSSAFTWRSGGAATRSNISRRTIGRSNASSGSTSNINGLTLAAAAASVSPQSSDIERALRLRRRSERRRAQEARQLRPAATATPSTSGCGRRSNASSSSEDLLGVGTGGGRPSDVARRGTTCRSREEELELFRVAEEEAFGSNGVVAATPPNRAGSGGRRRAASSMIVEVTPEEIAEYHRTWQQRGPGGPSSSPWLRIRNFAAARELIAQQEREGTDAEAPSSSSAADTSTADANGAVKGGDGDGSDDDMSLTDEFMIDVSVEDGGAVNVNNNSDASLI